MTLRGFAPSCLINGSSLTLFRLFPLFSLRFLLRDLHPIHLRKPFTVLYAIKLRRSLVLDAYLMSMDPTPHIQSTHSALNSLEQSLPCCKLANLTSHALPPTSPFCLFDSLDTVRKGSRLTKTQPRATGQISSISNGTRRQYMDISRSTRAHTDGERPLKDRRLPSKILAREKFGARRQQKKFSDAVSVFMKKAELEKASPELFRVPSIASHTESFKVLDIRLLLCCHDDDVRREASTGRKPYRHCLNPTLCRLDRRTT